MVSFGGKMITATLYGEYLPVAVYDRDILLTEIFQTDAEGNEQGFPSFFEGLLWKRTGQETKKSGDTMAIQERKGINGEKNTGERGGIQSSESEDGEFIDWEMAMLTENSLFRENTMVESGMENVGEAVEPEPIELDNSEVKPPDLNEIERRQPVQKTKIDLDDYILYEKLIKDFYTVDPNTTANSEMINVEKLMGIDMRVDKNTEGPQILIYHTHSQETFADSIKGDSGTSIVGVGQHLSDLLTDTYGYQVLHHTGEYDKKTRDDAYTRALPEIQKILEENPTIQVVIDLHRDEMPEKTRLVTEVDGKKTAKFMFFNGLSWSKKTGQIRYLKNPNLQENLAFSFQLQKKANEYYPGLARRIYLKQYRYNMHVCPKTTLIELGAQNNTVEEVMNACEPLAEILDMVLTGTE